MTNITDLLDENKFDYNSDKKIDIHNLHTEWLRQSELTGDYNKLLAQAEKEKDKTKEKIRILEVELDKIKAEFDLLIRTKPTEYDCPKDSKGNPDIKEAWIKNKLLLVCYKDEKYSLIDVELIKEKNNLIEATYKVGCYSAATKAMYDKKTAMEHLVYMLFKNYFTVPGLPKLLKLEDFNNSIQINQDDKSKSLREQGNIEISEQPKEQTVNLSPKRIRRG